MKLRGLLWILLALAVIGGVLLRRTPAPESADPATTAAARAPRAAGTPPAAVHAEPARPALQPGAPGAAPWPTDAAPPASETPLKDAFAALDHAARRGDAQAACRLGAELTACRYARINARHQMPPERLATVLASQALDERTLERRLDASLRNQENLTRRLAHCEGIDLEALPPAARYFMLAADAGHVPSMVQALSLENYAPHVLFRAPDLIPQFRASALRWLHGALEAGDPSVLPVLRQAADAPEFSAVAPLLPAAWREPGFVAALQARVNAARGLDAPAAAVHPGAPPPPAPPTAAQQAEAERLFARYFQDKLGPHPSAPAGVAADFTDAARFRCQETR